MGLFFFSRGAGYLGFVIPGAFALIAYLAANLVYGSKYSAAHSWPMAAGFILSAVPLWFIGRHLNARLFEAESVEGRFQRASAKHSSMGVPLEYFGLIVAALGLIALAIG